MFISHRGPDTKFGLVGDIKARLERSNVKVFMDADLEAGNFAWDTILAKLRGAKTVLLVLSPKFQTSWWCAASLTHKRSTGSAQRQVTTFCCSSLYLSQVLGRAAYCG